MSKFTEEEINDVFYEFEDPYNRAMAVALLEARAERDALEAEHARCTYASPDHLEAMTKELAKRGISVRMAGFTPKDQVERIAENERLRVALDAIGPDPRFIPGQPTQDIHIPYNDGFYGCAEELRAAMKEELEK